MSKTHQHWKGEPEEHDYPAAVAFLELVVPHVQAERLVAALRTSPTVVKKAKDLLRASDLPLLDADNPHVAADLEKVKAGQALSPVLLVRGILGHRVALTVADGYHRICASYHLDDDADIPLSHRRPLNVRRARRASCRGCRRVPPSPPSPQSSLVC